MTDSPDPTAIGVSYNVAFTLSGSFGTPTGTVTVSDGSASCGPVTLVSGAGNCNFILDDRRQQDDYRELWR